MPLFHDDFEGLFASAIPKYLSKPRSMPLFRTRMQIHVSQSTHACVAHLCSSLVRQAADGVQQQKLLSAVGHASPLALLR
jgi:hypothetical protein